MENNQKYMQRCLDLARNGYGRVAPNPLVGCVIINENKIIGEGYHSFFGGPHAEVIAINSVRDKSLLPHSTLFVNLEPCNHQGKTPPCSDLIIDMGIKKIVVASLDPNPLVSGKGLKRLCQNGCEVVVGVMESESNELNKRFFTFFQKKRPYIILKWAQSADGFIDLWRPFTSKPAQITSNKLRFLVHKWRSEEQAIMVGTNTALKDNPRLDVRYWKGRQPLRVVVDRHLKLQDTSNLLDGTLETLVITEGVEKKIGNTQYVALPFISDQVDLNELMNYFLNKQIQSVFVEGGQKLLQSFIDQGFWDEARIFEGNQHLGSGVKAPLIDRKPVLIRKFSKEKLSLIINQ